MADTNKGQRLVGAEADMSVRQRTQTGIPICLGKRGGLVMIEYLRQKTKVFLFRWFLLPLQMELLLITHVQI